MGVVRRQQAVDALEIDMGDVKVPGVEAGDKGLERLGALQPVALVFDEPDLVVHVVAQGGFELDADQAAALLLHRLVDLVQHAFGFAGAAEPGEQFDHRNRLLINFR